MFCANCSSQIENERLIIVPDTKVCASCATFFKLGQKKKGVMINTGKVGSEIQILSNSCFKAQKKYLIPNGTRSIIKNFSRSICA
jgi:hypothetical protein